MDLLLAISKYVTKLLEYGYYPKKKPSLGKLEKIADLIMAGKFRKLSRYLPEDISDDRRQEFEELMDSIKEIVKNEKTN